MKIRIDKYTMILFSILAVSSFLRLYDLAATGYTTDEPVIIVAGIKYFAGNTYDPSLYDMATPGGQFPIGLSIALFSGRDLSGFASFNKMDYASIDFNYGMFEGLEAYARMPSALAGIISGVLVYLLVKEMYGRKAGLASYSLFAFNPILIDYSRVALLEIYQIVYMLASIYLFYLWLSSKKNRNYYLIGCGAFLGLTASAKMNGLMLIPLFALFAIIKSVEVQKKKDAQFDFVDWVKNTAILVVSSVIAFGATFRFDFSVPLQVYNYYSAAGGAGIKFVLFSLLHDAVFFVNPLVWVLVAVSIYFINKDKKSIRLNDAFSLFLLFLVIFSGFFEAHESIKRGIQYILLFFIVASRLFSDKNRSAAKSKYWNCIPIIIVVADLLLVLYYFPYTGLAKSVVCTSQQCLDEHSTRNSDSKAIGNYINTLNGAAVYDTIATTGLVGFYSNVPYMTGGIAKLYTGGACPDFAAVKNANFTYVIDEAGCASALLPQLASCPSGIVEAKNYEMVTVYDIRHC